MESLAVQKVSHMPIKLPRILKAKIIFEKTCQKIAGWEKYALVQIARPHVFRDKI